MEDWSDLMSPVGPWKKSAQVLSTTVNGGLMTTFKNLSNITFHRSFWLMFFFCLFSFKLVRLTESGSMFHCRNKKHYENSCFADSTCNAFWVQVPDFSLETIIGIPMPGAPCDWHLCLQNRAYVRFQKVESGDTFLQSAFIRQFTIVWWKPQSSNLPISCFNI